jgi:hypothetical protein
MKEAFALSEGFLVSIFISKTAKTNSNSKQVQTKSYRFVAKFAKNRSNSVTS